MRREKALRWTWSFTEVYNWHQLMGQSLLNGKPFSKPEFRNGERLTLMLAQDLIPYLGETKFVTKSYI